MYSIVEFKKNTNHVKGAGKQDVIQENTGYKTLLLAEKDFYLVALACAGDGKKKRHLCIEDNRYNDKIEFFDPTTCLVRVRGYEKNEIGKYKYLKFTLEEYRQYLKDKKHNKLTEVI